VTTVDPRWARPLVQRFRALCLSLPDTSEVTAWGHPTFKSKEGKTFAAFEIVKGRPSMAFRLDPKDQASISGRADAVATPYGRGQWISLWADGRVSWTLVGRLVRRSYKTVSAPPAKGPSRRPAPARQRLRARNDRGR
jgi:predicted DNA-binding protein (MmcQ/YjbR family)